MNSGLRRARGDGRAVHQPGIASAAAGTADRAEVPAAQHRGAGGPHKASTVVLPARVLPQTRSPRWPAARQPVPQTLRSKLRRSVEQRAHRVWSLNDGPSSCSRPWARACSYSAIYSLSVFCWAVAGKCRAPSALAAEKRRLGSPGAIHFSRSCAPLPPKRAERILWKSSAKESRWAGCSWQDWACSAWRREGWEGT